MAGNTIPIVVNSNFIVGGLSNATYYYIDAIGGRKAIIMNGTVMGLSGHFTRLILLLASNLRMNKQEHDCGTVHAAKLTVSSKTHLKKLVGRNYRTLYQRNYKPLRADQTELIGETIYVRSPAYCADEEICSTCYGELFFTNKDLESIGGYSATKITEPVSQSILSSKHLLTTNSEKIEFDNPLFSEIFTIYANEILLRTDSKVDLSRYDLVIIKGNIIQIDPFDDMESEFNKLINIFHICDKETGEIIEFTDKTNTDLYLSPAMDDFIRYQTTASKKDKKKIETKYGKGTIVVPLDEYNHKEPVFIVEVENNELTRPLYAIIDLLDNKSKREKSGVYSVDQMIQRMIDLLIESKIIADSIHGELLIRCLVRSSENVLDMPDFRRYDAKENIEIMTIKSALEKHPSVTVSLSFQAINRQLQNMLTFKKTKPSYIDPFFKQ